MSRSSIGSGRSCSANRNAFVLTRATRTARLRHSRIIRISDKAFRLSPHAPLSLGSMWTHQSSSRLRVVSCIPQCVLVPTSVIQRGELRRLGILPCDQIFDGQAGSTSSNCGMISVGSGKSVETSRLGSAPTASHARFAATCGRIAVLLALASRIERRMSQSRSMTMRSVVFARKSTNTPLDHFDSNLCRRRFGSQHTSPKLGNSILQGLPFKRMQAVWPSCGSPLWKSRRRLEQCSLLA